MEEMHQLLLIMGVNHCGFKAHTFQAFFWPLKVIKTHFSYFNHQIKSKPSLDCNMRLIKFSSLCPDTAVCEALSKNGLDQMYH